MRPPDRSPGRAALLLLVAAPAAGCGRESAAFASGPYVQTVSETGAVIAQVSAEPARLEVEVSPADGEGLGAGSQIIEEGEPARVHALAFGGLAPDTAYRYRVRDAASGALRGEATFRTAPPPGGRAITFAAFADTGANKAQVGTKLGPLAGPIGELAWAFAPGRQGTLARLVRERDPDLCLHAGDVVYPDGARERWGAAFFRPFGALIRSVPLYALPGEHDLKTEDGRPFDEVFHPPTNGPAASPRTYSFDCGDVHFVAFDVTSGGGSSRERREWLAEDLARTSATWKVVLIQEPPFSDGKKGDSEGIKKHIVPILESLGVDLVLSGDDHNYQRFWPIRGITYIVTGGGGVSTYPVATTLRTAYTEAVLHFVFGTADAREMTLEAIDLEGRVFDAVTLAKDRR